MKSFILFIFFLALNLKVNSQIHISVEGDCEYYNSALFCDALCKCMGEKTISRWLKEKIWFGFYCYLDSMGCVKTIKQIHPLPVQKKIGKRVIKKIEKYLVRHHVSFHLCMYYPELGVDGYKRLLREQFQRNNTIPYPIGSFPYHFMFGYKKEGGFTPYEHLIREIGKYI